MNATRALATPVKGNTELLAFYNDKLCQLIDFELPFESDASPRQRGQSDSYQIVSQLNYLFFKARSSLDGVLQELAELESKERTRTCLSEILKRTMSSTQGGKLHPPFPSSTIGSSSRLNASKMERRSKPDHLLSDPVTLEDVSGQRDDEVTPEPSSPTLQIKHNTSRRLPQPLAPPFLDVPADTSFTTSTTTSFTSARVSFMSDISVSNVSQETKATSVADEDINESPFPLKQHHASLGAANQEMQTFTASPVTPPKPAEVMAAQTHAKSVDFRVRCIPKHGIGSKTPDSWLVLSYHLCLSAYRASDYCGISISELDRQWVDPRTSETLLSLADRYRNHNKRPFVIEEAEQCLRQPLLARLVWSVSGDRVFSLKLEPAQAVQRNIYERRFGAHRFLIVDTCQVGKPPSHFKKFRKEIQELTAEMLGEDQDFLGRTWVQFLPKERKGESKSSKDTDTPAPGTHKLFFFATSGRGLETVSVTQLVEWFIPLKLNTHQTACKAFSRLELALSRGKSAHVFECKQIRYGSPGQYGLPDIKPSDRADAWSDRWNYDDLEREKDFGDGFAVSQEVMNDGCALISVAAMECVRQKLKLNYIPTAVQARIFGAKGVWYCDGADLPSPIKPDDIWIEIRESQVKVRRDITAWTDKELRTLIVLKHTHRLSNSYLYTGFMPIMLHRGVPENAILEVAGCHIKDKVLELADRIDNLRLLHAWIHDDEDLVQKRERHVVKDPAHKPRMNGDEIAVEMLESGFEPTENKFLAEEALLIGRNSLGRELRKSKSPVQQSTLGLGIADISGLLAPGEIQINFSEAIQDPTTCQSWSTLQDMDVLVARNPAQRDSDIQKVRVVHYSKLARLKDVVIFSTQGRRPLGAKLSGGDYDGDTYSIYWDQRLVRPFRNAPTPLKLTPLPDMFITVDKTKLGDIITSTEKGQALDLEVRSFIKRQTAARMRFACLGIVTNAYTQHTYPDNDLNSLAANMLNDLHDYLVDADKNGYIFAKSDWMDFCKHYNIDADPKPPRYREFLKGNMEDFNLSKLDGILRRSKCGTHILDKFYFDVSMTEIAEGIRKMEDSLSAAVTRDKDLEQPYDQVWQTVDDNSSIYRRELKQLRAKFEPLVKAWAKSTARHRAATKQNRNWANLVTSLNTMFHDIKPDNPKDPVVVEWCRPQGADLSMWDKLKTSALAKFHYQKYRMVFSIACTELCKLKAQMSQQRSVVLPIHAYMKPRKPRVNEMDEDLSDDSDVDSDFGDSESLVGALEDYIESEPTSHDTPITPPSRKRLQRNLTSGSEEFADAETPSKRVQSARPK